MLYCITKINDNIMSEINVMLVTNIMKIDESLVTSPLIKFTNNE